LLDTQQRQTAAQTAACQCAEQQLQVQAQQLLQLQRVLDNKGQQLRQQAQAHTEELQVCMMISTINMNMMMHAPPA
jgi:hypothetical protein